MSCPFGSAEQQAPEARQACPVARLRPEAPVTLAPQSRSGLVADFLPSCFAWLSGRPATRTPIGASRGEAAAHPGPARGAEPQLDEEHPVATFLQAAGLGQYTEALLQSGFDDMETLLDIEAPHMKDLGMVPGHILKLRKRLEEFRAAQQRPAPAPVSSSRCLPTNEMTRAVEQSWEQAKALGTEAVGELLFRNLFELAPEVLQLFPFKGEKEALWSSPCFKQHAAKVVNAVGSAVAGLHDLERLVPMLRQLGERHVAYGVKEAHYQVLGQAVLRTLRAGLGEAFTGHVEAAWTIVFGFVAGTMIGDSYAFGAAARPAPPAVGQQVPGGRELYCIQRHLQRAIFGDVFAAKGLRSGRSFAMKVLDRQMVDELGTTRAQDEHFCEAPLCEVRYVEVMRGLEHVAQMEDHFADSHYYYVISELASGGDLLEVLKQKPSGFSERQAQVLIRDVAKGLVSLHRRGLAMQDVSLENMLLYVKQDGLCQVRVCDPGQAVTFLVDPLTGAELPLPFKGFVAKQLRPPELYLKQDYLATKVDAWCLGWSTFYLLTAQQLFQNTDPAVSDPDWALFNRRGFSRLFQEKGWHEALSSEAVDFILRLLQVNPRQRMSVKYALRHPWLTDQRAPAAMRLAQKSEAPAGAPRSSEESCGGGQASASQPETPRSVDSAAVTSTASTVEIHVSSHDGPAESPRAWGGESTTPRPRGPGALEGPGHRAGSSGQAATRTGAAESKGQRLEPGAGDLHAAPPTLLQALRTADVAGHCLQGTVPHAQPCKGQRLEAPTALALQTQGCSPSNR
mmetsp:Transcript_50738/g.162372  ORF Transcript_50738/g.162372 Transcript_50738/m.162372 type:complete len:793 (-) Transcript_50738:31-2409(-)